MNMARVGSISWKVLATGVLGPGGLRVTATPDGLSRVELWTALPGRYRRRGSRPGRPEAAVEVLDAGGPRNPLLNRAVDELASYFAGHPPRFETPLDLSGERGGFQMRIWELLRDIPRGNVWTYGEIARRAGAPRAARATGQAVGRNPLPVVLPCHRVVGHGGHLTGFSCGLPLKVQLLEHEGFRLSASSSASRRRVLEFSA
ncbi:MAG: methylated-DNA--[protein]-cysteine S-methyltransferase [Planctomycetota bacterium]|nr:methylated-DNA--[protein]-cysteine S-methyltransferase [Planctomycetota bacterium]